MVTIYGGCYRCHSRIGLRRAVRTDTLRAEECWDRAACDKRRLDPYADARVRQAAERAISGALDAITRARAARDLGRLLRAGKPASFRPSVGVHRGYGSMWR